MRELKEQNLIHVVWCKSEDMPADLFTKNLSGPLFNKHAKQFCGEDEYMWWFEVGESVRVHFKHVVSYVSSCSDIWQVGVGNFAF